MIKAIRGWARNASFKEVLAWIMFLGGIIMWPISALTFARQEPQFILGLSFLAIIIEGFNAIGIHKDE